MITISGSRLIAEGYTLAAMNDPSHRRGIWFRKNDDGSLEVKAGREGDDDYFKVLPDNPIIHQLYDVLTLGAWTCQQAGLVYPCPEEDS